MLSLRELSRVAAALAFGLTVATCAAFGDGSAEQESLIRHVGATRNVSAGLFAELEELSRIVDISYCVGGTSLGVYKPFQCLSRCTDFPQFELVTTWNTGLLLSDSCGYIALDHGKERVIVAFRGTYSIANTIVDLSTIPQEYVPYPGAGNGVDEDGTGESAKHQHAAGDKQQKCQDCRVHMGFHTAWLHTRERIWRDLQEQLLIYPDYALNLVGHSLGGAVAALAGLELQARHWDPIITTFGEPRIGNAALAQYLDQSFGLNKTDTMERDDMKWKYRRVTHIDDPVPLLPLSEWGFAMHAGEIFISKAALSPDIGDLEHCDGDNDRTCIAGQDSTITDGPETPVRGKSDLIGSVMNEVHDVVNEPWGIPSRYKLWQLFFAHRDYFWRLGLCVPGGDPLGGGEKYEVTIPTHHTHPDPDFG